MFDMQKEDYIFPDSDEQLFRFYLEHVPLDYDVEIAFLEGSAQRLLSLSPNQKSKKISWVHIDLQNAHWTSKYFPSEEVEGDSYKKVNYVVFVSAGALEGFKKRFHFCPKHAEIILNPIPIKTIDSLAIEYTVPKRIFTFCTIASLTVRKGHNRLLLAMARLISEGYRFELNLIGTGSQEQALKELAQILNISQYVHFLGFLNNPYPYIKSADVVIHPSLAEGYPLALCEALSLMVPIAATACNGNLDVLKNGEYGMVVENTENGLYMGMKQILDNPAVLESLKQKAKNGRQQFLYDSTIMQIKQLLGGEKDD